MKYIYLLFIYLVLITVLFAFDKISFVQAVVMYILFRISDKYLPMEK